MTTIVTRAGKGSPLTNTEVDSNFTNLNTAKIETLTSTDTSVTITGTGSSRDLSVPVNPNVVSGPASATDNAVARFDGTTGKLIQNSTAATIDDSGNADFLSQKADFFDVDTAATTSTAVGRIRWNAAKGTAVLGEIGGNLEAAIGQTVDAYVTNAEATTITKGQAVYLFSAQGDRATVKLAYNTGDATSAKTFGIAAEDITSNGTGLVRCVGVLDGLTLGSYTAGDSLYLGATAGSLTATKPYAPNHLVYIGVVERANNGNGQLYVRVQNGYELDEIHDVQIISPANGNLLIRDQTNSLWKNANLTAGTGISVAGSAGSITVENTGVTSVTASTGISVSSSTGGVTITNSAPDQTVAISSGSGISVTGTYPNFTVTNTAGGASISDDTTTNATRYPLYAAATSGTASTVYVSSTKFTFNPSTGALTVAGDVTSSSDERVKTNWRSLPADFLERIAQVKSGVYDRTDLQATQTGVSAQSLQSVLSEAVTIGEDGKLSVAYGQAALVTAIELAKVVQELRTEITMLKAKVGE